MYIRPMELTANTNPHFMYEFRRETSKNESLANNDTTMMLITETILHV
jgi:hypothetical protein